MAIALWLCIAVLLSTHSQALPSLVSFPGPDGVTLTGVLYTPSGFDGCQSKYPAMVLMHGCSGIWSRREVNATNEDGSPNLQNHIEKWGRKLASENIVALAVDSFTPRAPPSISTNNPEWQNHCSGNKYAGTVDPYTTRVQDARAAWEYLVSLGKISSKSIGLLGWSHGGETTMVEAAATPRYINRERVESEYRFAALVSFYSGCGGLLGFMDRFGGTSFWRPYQGFQLNVGEQDAFYANCKTRIDIARREYGSLVNFPTYPEAHHSFDAKEQTWPTGKCESTIGDLCTMYAADIDSLHFIKRYLFAHGSEEVDCSSAAVVGEYSNS